MAAMARQPTTTRVAARRTAASAGGGGRTSAKPFNSVHAVERRASPRRSLEVASQAGGSDSPLREQNLSRTCDRQTCRRYCEWLKCVAALSIKGVCQIAHLWSRHEARTKCGDERRCSPGSGLSLSKSQKFGRLRASFCQNLEESSRNQTTSEAELGMGRSD